VLAMMKRMGRSGAGQGAGLRSARLLAATLTVALAATSADAAGLRAQCRRACKDEIAAAVAGGARRAAARRDLIGQCLQEGLQVCLSPDDTTGDGRRSRASWSNLLAPAVISAATRSQSSIEVRWADPNNSETAYLVERAGSLTGPFALVASLGRNTTVYWDTGLPAARTFWYRVRAIGRKGAVSPYSAVVNATTFSSGTSSTTTSTTSTTTTTLPVAPSTTTTTTRPPTTTTTSTSTTTTRPPTTTTTTRPPTTTTTTRPPTTTTTTRPSTTTTTTTTTSTTTTQPPDATAPSTPTGVSAAATSCSAMFVVWSSSTDTGGAGLFGYRLYRNGAFVRQVVAPATSTVDTGLAASSVYSYAVSAIDEVGNESARSMTASANTPACPDTTPPATPAALTATPSSCTQVSLSWSGSTDTGGSGLRGYNVFRNGGFVKQVLAPATAAADAGLTPQAAYGYAVSAVDNSGNESARTTAVSTTTPGCTAAAPWLEGTVPAIGAAKDLVRDPVTGRILVASIQFGLAVADVGAPSAPRVLGVANPPFYGERVAASGPLALVSGNSMGLRVVDVSDPTDPAVIGSLAGTFKGVALSGQYGFAIQVVPGNPARIDVVSLDLRVPSAPVIVARLTVPGGTELDLVGEDLFVPAGAAGLYVLDVGVPTSPRLRGILDTPGVATDVAVAGNLAWVADNTAVLAVDVSNPSAPALRGSLATPATAIAVSGARVYALGATQLKVIDGSVPAVPALLGVSSGYGAQGIDAAGTLVYLASAEVNALTQAGGLYVIDASVPATPRVLANRYGGFDNAGVSMAGTLAVVGGNMLGLRVVDVRDVSAPRTLGSLVGTFKGTAMAGSYAYAIQVVPGNPARTEVAVIDLRSPSVPAIVGRATVAGGSDLRVAGNLAYVPTGAAGLQVVDVSSPTAPRLVGTVDTPGSATGVAITGAWAYVADGTAIRAVDLSNPAAPVIRGSLGVAATAIAAAGNRVYALSGTQLHIVDVSAPASPALLGSSAGYGAQGLSASGSLVALATPGMNHFDPAGGVYVIDAASPTQPRLLKQVIVPGTTRCVAAVGNWVYAGDSAGVVDVIGLVP
jgi:hypothetical protein